MIQPSPIIKATNKGQWLHKIPSCFPYPFFSLDIAEGCYCKCTYCILQSYLSHKKIKIHANFLDSLNKIDAEIKQKATNAYISTGIFADSLIINELYPYFEGLYHLSIKNPNCNFELRSKIDNINNIKNNNANCNNIIFAWSLTPQFIISNLEKGTSSLEKRLKAAVGIIKKGYRLALHFDPIIYYHNYEANYYELIKYLATEIPADQISFISLGALRFPQSFLDIIKNEYKNHWLFQIEFVPIYKNTYSYLRFIRISLYKNLIYLLRNYLSNDCPIYIMEEDNSFALLKEKNN